MLDSVKTRTPHPDPVGSNICASQKANHKHATRNMISHRMPNRRNMIVIDAMYSKVVSYLAAPRALDVLQHGHKLEAFCLPIPTR